MSKFFDLCSDSLWGIRKACADCFMIVSNSTSPEVQRTKLSPLFSSLISDQSRWVRQAAFQSLGRFISTFANPSSTGLYFKEDGTLLEVPTCPSDRLGHKHKPTAKHTHCHRTTLGVEQAQLLGGAEQAQLLGGAEQAQLLGGAEQAQLLGGAEQAQLLGGAEQAQLLGGAEQAQLLGGAEQAQLLGGAEQAQLLGGAEQAHVCVCVCVSFCMCLPAQVQVLSAALKAAQLESQSEEEGESESQTPEDREPDEESSQHRVTTEETQTPEPPTQQAKDPAPTEEQKEAEAETEKEPEPYESPPNSPVLVREDSDHSSVEPELMESLEGKEDSAFNQVCEEKSKVQNVIPQQLLDQYLSMTDPAQAQTVDTEIAKHCAFSLPGVALTLGRQNWHCLKDTYETLATDVQWKVRRTLAFSIHDLALILGDQLTAADLVPIFNGFLKDLDEVRIGVLKHLYDFLKLLHAENRREYLYQLQEFMVTDNSRNWRFRYQLAEQLILIMELYSHDDVYNYLRQIALTLCSDKVSEVRWISYQLVVEILQKMYACGAHELGLNFSNELIVRFCHCPKWVGRQAFAFICQAIVEEDCMPMDQFAQHLLPSLLSLSLDPVANVRVLVAKALRQSVMEKAYFKEPGSAYLEELEETVMTLQADKDRDVRFFASLDPDMVLMDTSALI
ncbi:serine/threonine-protein phosphatase 4 regulatory subunit 1-like [Oncorhynchus kisutch]|uniref:serine/threonine-protein phosphatase 4 regulatory subunit 1-like n=1 Tax=Oncorhynchus kisutch TaxID=8019 RepID=UPI0012DF48B4|nr:serine/threonine-protein phosphatase 4 regulatory subunit 1-like [Oncorhynchus kisutch]